jgi:hypothetical protein
MDFVCYMGPSKPSAGTVPFFRRSQQFFVIAQEIRNLDGKKVLWLDAVALGLSRKVTNPQPGPVTVCDSETV